MCKTRRNPQVHAIEPGTGDSENEFCINYVETKGKSEDDWNVSVYCEGKQVNMKIDTGAQCNVMSMQTYQSISKKPAQKSKTRLITYSGHKLTTADKTLVTVTHKGKCYAVPFQIVDKNIEVWRLKI